MNFIKLKNVIDNNAEIYLFGRFIKTPLKAGEIGISKNSFNEAQIMFKPKHSTMCFSKADLLFILEIMEKNET